MLGYIHAIKITFFVSTQKANSTLPQLSSGLQAFKLHFDWLLHWYHQSGLESSKIKEIASLLESISVLAQRQVKATVLE